jgi:hypothetical protein
MASADELRHRLLYLAILVRNTVRRLAWKVLAAVPTRSSRETRSTDLLGPAGATARPTRPSQPGALDHYALHLAGDLVIEPTYGWIISGRTRIIEPSMPYHQWSSLVPNLLAKPSLAAAVRRPTRNVGPVVSLRIAWDDNYYHFYNDVLGRLRLIDSVVPPEVPVLLGGSMAEAPYVQAAIERGVFGDREVILQGADERLRCSEVYLVNKCGGDRRDWDYFLDRLDDRGPGSGNRRVLLVRSPERGRSLGNDSEVRGLCRSRGFEAVDTDGWTLAEQIDLFRDTAVVVGVHGAGLTNIAHRRGGALRLLELIPPGPFPLSFNAEHGDESDYESLCRYFGFGYSSMTGSIDGRLYKRTQDFSVDIAALDAALDALEA